MGLKYRTPMGTLREQRRHAEVARPPIARGTATMLKARALDSLQSSHKDSMDQNKSRILLERLRHTLQDDRSQQGDASKDLESLEDELSRINLQHLAKNGRAQESLQDLPLNQYRGSNQPFSLVVIEGEKSGNFEFPRHIPRLEAPLSNFDPYMKNLYSAQESIKRPTLVSAKEPQAPRSAPKDHSDEAAQLVQDTMTVTSQDKQSSPIPTSLALSLLND